MQIQDSAGTSETKDPAELQLFSSSVTKFATSIDERFVTLLCSSGLTYMFKKTTWGLYHKTYYGRNFRNKLECLSLASLSSLVYPSEAPFYFRVGS